MIKPIALDDLERDTENIYEAICVISKRARRINNEQKKYLEDLISTYEEGGDDFDDEDIAREKFKKAINDLPKPVSVALREMLARDIRFDYLNPENEIEE